jgi:hypothetical protein
VTASQEAGGPWLDMSRYPDGDPDEVLSPGEHALLTDALAVDDAALPDAVFEHMLAVVTGDAGEDGADTADDPDADPGADDDLLAADDGQGWTDDLAHALGLDGDPIGDPTHEPDPATDPGADPGAGHDGHGGWV